MQSRSVSILCLILLSLGGCSKKSRNQEKQPDDQPENEVVAQRSKVPPRVLKRSGNPFLGVRFFVNPEFARNVESTVAKAKPAEATLVRKVAAYPTAIWLASIAETASLGHWLDLAHEQQVQTGQLTLSVFVIYDLPNRDCAAKVSSGELLVGEEGERRYKAEFIDSIAEQFESHSDQPIVVILEPDSLANLVSNLGIPKCAAAERPYKRLIAYAIWRLTMPNVSIYLDAAHAGWLGWLDNRGGIAKIYKDVLRAAGGAGKIRGFATNVANYTSLQGISGKALAADNPCANELEYVAALARSLREAGIANVGFVVDTSRNGVDYVRRSWSHWCNLARAGLGERPQAAPMPGIDAYYWIKPPGESDGLSDASQPNFDEDCRSPDSLAGAPAGGMWFGEQFLRLVRNANPPL